MTLGAIGAQATNDNVMVGSVVRDHNCEHITIRRRRVYPEPEGWWHVRSTYGYETWDNYNNSPYYIVSHPLDTLEWEDFDRNHHTIISQPADLIGATTTTATQETTNMTTTTDRSRLGAPGEVASNDNVMIGTIIRYSNGSYDGEHRLTAAPERIRDYWRCDFTGQGTDGLNGSVYLTDSNVTIVSHPVTTGEPTVEQLQADFKVFAERLLSEARSRGWCADYDTYVRRCNSETTHLKLIPCRRNVHVSFRLRIDDSNGLTDDQIREAVRNHANGHLIRGEVLINSEEPSE